MPKNMERTLKKQCKKKGMSKKGCDKYTYGTMRKTGWKPSHQRRSSGRGR